MVSINYAFREISCKIVYYGPGLSGKTTNLQYVHDRLPKKSRGDLISLATEADRTLYFDFLPLELGEIGGFATKFQMYTVPGQVFYNATRKLVLRGVDGIVFVADSQKTKMDDNLESLADMEDNLKSYNLDIHTMPIVIQYNKRDLPDIVTIEEMEAVLNKHQWPYIEAAAVKGQGVFDTMKRVSKLVLADLKKRTSEGAVTPAGGSTPTPTAQTPVKTSASRAELASIAARPTAVVSAAGVATKRVAAASESVAVAERDTHEDEIPVAPVAGSTVSKLRDRPEQPSGAPVMAAQKSTRVRRRRRSQFDRLFGWLFGR